MEIFHKVYKGITKLISFQADKLQICVHNLVLSIGY